MARAVIITPRITLAELCSALGMKPATYYAHWKGIFTPYRCERELRFSMDEVEEALAHTDSAKARAAVLRLRRLLGRLTTPTE